MLLSPRYLLAILEYRGIRQDPILCGMLNDKGGVMETKMVLEGQEFLIYSWSEYGEKEILMIEQELKDALIKKRTLPHLITLPEGKHFSVRKA